jgi:hypothetical protein
VLRDDQLDAREGRAGRPEVAERFVLPLKPGNAGGGKEPQFKADAIRSDPWSRLLASRADVARTKSSLKFSVHTVQCLTRKLSCTVHRDSKRKGVLDTNVHWIQSAL